MKIVNINSGLGNQMFQFAFYLAIKDKYKSENIKLDVSWYEDFDFHHGFELKRIFGIKSDYSTHQENISLSRPGYNWLGRIKRRLFFKKKSEILESKEQQFCFFPELYGKEKEDNYYLGFWQSYKYFESIPEIILNNFKFPPLSESKNISIYDFIKKNKGGTVSIHIRRGDYLKHKSLGGVCSMDYYTKAILKMEEKIIDPIYIIFSDDIDWCKVNFELLNVKFVDWNTGKLAFRDLQLMSLCDNNIIANSSFSWWGAYLNCNKNKTIIAPKTWIRSVEDKDLIPVNWIRL